jgi:hypothetical protein
VGGSIAPGKESELSLPGANKKGALDEAGAQPDSENKTTPSQDTMQAYFTPGFDLTLEQAAELSKFKNFNWYQKVTSDDKNAFPVPRTDPPKDTTIGQDKVTDDLPYYFDQREPSQGVQEKYKELEPNSAWNEQVCICFNFLFSYSSQHYT